MADQPPVCGNHRYWYCSFRACGADDGLRDHYSDTEHPIDFIQRCNRDFLDGPYILLFAMQISERQYYASPSHTVAA